MSRVNRTWPPADYGTSFERGLVERLRDSLPDGVHVDTPLGAGGPTLFALAAAEPTPDFIDMLLERGADPSQRNDRNEGALHWACPQSIAVWKRLIAAGADVNLTTTDEKGEWPMFNAIRGSRPEIVALLIEHGGKVDGETPRGDFPLLEAATRGSAGIVRLLLKAGADPNYTSTAERRPLGLAAMHGHLDVVTMLLAHGADPDGPNLAAGARYYERLPQLYRWPYTLPSLHGYTALHFAARNSHLAVASTLLRAGASLEARTEDGVTPLLEVAMSAKAADLLFLLNHGADATARDSKGRGLDYYARHGMDKTMLSTLNARR